MRIYSDESLRNFEFWSQAYDNATELSYEDLDVIEGILEEQYPDGMSATELNDLFWHDFDTVLEWVGKEYFGSVIVDTDEIEELDASEFIQAYGDNYSDTLWNAYTTYMEGIDEDEWAYTNVDDIISDGADEEGQDEVADALFNEMKADEDYEVKDDGYGTYRVVRVY